MQIFKSKLLCTRQTNNHVSFQNSFVVLNPTVVLFNTTMSLLSNGNASFSVKQRKNY